MKDEAQALLKVWTKVFLSLSYAYLISSKIPKGKLRLLSLLPVVTLHTLLPLCLSSALPTGITSFFITWLANFKLLLFSFDLGPLSSSPSLPRFILTAAFPVKINTHSNPKPSKTLIPLNLGSKILISGILIAFCEGNTDTLPQWALFGIYCIMLYLFLDIVIGIANILVGSLMGGVVHLEPPSNEPYLATSLQDFWGRRWNLMVTDTLRHTVYLPLRAFLSERHQWRKDYAVAASVAASFLVSGFMHELIFYYMTHVRPTWEVTWFFVLHGLCVVVEVTLKRRLGNKVRLHWAITGPLTVVFVIGTAFWCFFPPLVRNQVDVSTLREIKALYQFIKKLFQIQ